jgi:hypothetical protein
VASLRRLATFESMPIDRLTVQCVTFCAPIIYDTWPEKLGSVDCEFIISTRHKNKAHQLISMQSVNISLHTKFEASSVDAISARPIRQPFCDIMTYHVEYQICPSDLIRAKKEGVVSSFSLTCPYF